LRRKPITLPPPQPRQERREREESEGAILDVTDDLDDLDLDDDPDGWDPPTTADRGARVGRPPSAPARSGPTQTGTVDVSGLIPEKTQPPERIVPVPTVDATALGGGGSAGSASGRVGSIIDRLPLPANAPVAPPRPQLASPPRAVRALIPDESGTETVPEVSPIRPSPRLAVPVGGPDSSSTLLEDDQRRDDPTSIDPATHRFERGDPTIGSDPTDVRGVGAGVTTPKARLRTIAQLRRKRGLGGDMRYVLTAIFGLRRARRELGALEAKQASLQQSRRRHLITLGRTAVTADGFDHPALGDARERLRAVEEERSKHTGQVAAADGELQRVTRDRDAKAKQYAADLAEIDAELAELARKLEPLEKEAAGVTRRAADLRDSMRRIDAKIAFTEARLSAADTEEADRGAIQAEIASLKADRKSVQKDEPVLASSLDSLHPRIAKLEAARAEARKRRVEVEQGEREDQRRAEELLAAIGAKRKVVDRAASDAEALRDKILFELGDRLYVDRPESMAPELSPIDAIDVELGTFDRRTMELREILSSVDRMKLARGIALWIVLLTAIGVITALVLGVTPPI
jgi:predicted  nucleic acid-binding Zn-ribbon protein